MRPADTSLDSYQRMADAAKTRSAKARADEEVGILATSAANRPRIPLMDGESDLIGDHGRHTGHRTHIGRFHGNGVVCSCGELMGCFSIVLTDDMPAPPDRCPICEAHQAAREG